MIDTLRALTVAANSLRFNPRIGIDTGEQYERVLTDLRDKLGREVKNDPLTLDELREMDGEPVWVVFTPDIDGERLSIWALVSVDENNEIFLQNSLGGRSAYKDVAADIEAIYRRKPEKGERA